MRLKLVHSTMGITYAPVVVLTHAIRSVFVGDFVGTSQVVSDAVQQHDKFRIAVYESPFPAVGAVTLPFPQGTFESGLWMRWFGKFSVNKVVFYAMDYLFVNFHDRYYLLCVESFDGNLLYG